LRKELFTEDDEDLKELQSALEQTQANLQLLEAELADVQSLEKTEMDQWLARYGVERLVHNERISVLQSREKRIASRSDQLAEEKDLLDASQDILGWIQSV
jgi:transposase